MNILIVCMYYDFVVGVEDYKGLVVGFVVDFEFFVVEFFFG